MERNYEIIVASGVITLTRFPASGASAVEAFENAIEMGQYFDSNGVVQVIARNMETNVILKFEASRA